MIRARIDKDGWCRCGECVHKLFRLVKEVNSTTNVPLLEIKCHSCKSINKVFLTDKSA